MPLLKRNGQIHEEYNLMHVQFHGAAGEVTGSCHLVQVGDSRILLDCGLIQGTPGDEARNHDPFPFDPKSIDAVVLSHAHIDHSGRIPLLVKSGFQGPIYTQHACRDLCRIMLKDSGYLNEKDAEWENRKRERKGLVLIEPLYTIQDAVYAMRRFKGIAYDKRLEILPGITIRLSDAGHIIGSSIIELWLQYRGANRKLVFSGDLGHRDAPILKDPAHIRHADLVILESTYGDRLHRRWDKTLAEIQDVINTCRHEAGNILIPSFAVGRSQMLLYLFGKYRWEWGLEQWQIFLDSPMAIEATAVYMRHSELFDRDATNELKRSKHHPLLPNLHFTRTAKQSMMLNRVRSGAIIIAGSGMCTGGRIRHHLKHNVWRKDCHIIMVGFQAAGTPGRALVDGSKQIRLWGETIQVKARLHTIGGLSAHADQKELMDWYRKFEGQPQVALVHGEADTIAALASRMETALGASVIQAKSGDRIDLLTVSSEIPT